jgi:carbon storage regulator
MLVLSRKTSQRITIGDNVVVTVLRTDRGTVKLGIDAPPEVRVVRGEIANRTGPETLAEVIERLDLMGTTGH